MNQQVGIALPLREHERSLPGRVSKHKLRVSLVGSLLASDLLTIILGNSLASLLRYGDSLAGLQTAHILSILPIYLLSAAATRACAGEALINLAEALKRGVLALMATASVLFFLLFAYQQGSDVSRVLLISGFAISAILLLGFRAVHVKYARNQLGGELYSVLVLHDGNYPAAPGHPLPINVGSAFDPARQNAEGYHRLAGLLSSADRVVVRCLPERRDQWAHVLQGMNVHAEIMAPEIAQTRASGIGSFAGRPTYVVASGPLNLRDRMVKRAFDIAVAGSATLALAPLLLLVAAAIKLDSSGPVFFRQKRIGRQNRLFDIYKFRSMRTERCDGAGIRSTARDDDRITRVGSFIRRTSIDELPQLLNVLMGDMSIVGPRPHAVHSTARAKLFWEVDKRYWYRHACKPGITGLAQIRGFRGATHEERDLTDRLEADLEYVEFWSFWNDVAILLKTASVLVHKNAY